MDESEDPSLCFLPRIREELDKLPLTKEQKTELATRLLKRAVDLDGLDANKGYLTADSPYFEFAKKIGAVVEQFKADGLTQEAYLAAALRRPELMFMNPATVIGNIDGMVKRFEAEGLTTRAYLDAALKRPAILDQSPETISNNLTGVVSTFQDSGMTVGSYLAASLKQPQLFQQVPDTIIGNIMGVVNHFANDGLTRQAYVKAAIKQPSLFGHPAASVIANVTEVVRRYEGDGLTTRTYLDAALRQPSLFASSPLTISRHIDAVLDLADRGIFTPPSTGRKDRQATEDNREPVRAAALEFLLRNPAILSLADDNIGLREAHQRLINGPTDYRLFNTPRHAVERDLMQHLGHHNPRQPVPNDGFAAGMPSPTKEQAERFVLRALMHAGLIRGGSMER